VAQKRLADAKWGVVREEIRSILIESAKLRQTITYSELCMRLQTATLHYHSSILTRLMDEVCEDEWDKGHGKLCALIVLKATGIPGGGYFSHMPQSDDLEAAWRQDLEDVFSKSTTPG